MTIFQYRESQIFKDSRWLQPLSDPPSGKPLCRDADLKTMASFLSDIFTTGQARNLFIYGKPGTGKTVCIQYLLNEIRKHANENHIPMVAVYVNAGKTRSPYYTMLEIVKALGLNVPDYGWQMFRLKQAFEGVLKDKVVVIAIDEVDGIIFKEKEPLVYYLNRQPKTTLILISNRIEDAMQLPERALSTLHPRLLKLEPYTSEEASKILQERAEHAFKPGVITEKLLNIIATAASEAGDIRLGFHTLLSAALLAEKAGKQRIEDEDVQAALQGETKLEKLKKIEDIKRQIDDLKKNRERNRLCLL